MKFMFRSAGRSLIRHRYKSILNIFLCALMTLLLGLYMGSLESSRRMLRKLPEVIPVAAAVTNLNGSMDSELIIKEELADCLFASEHVKNPVATVRLMLGFGEFSMEDWIGNLTMYGAGSNSIYGADGLTAEGVTLMEGVSEDFLESDRKECLITPELLEAEGLKVGDMVTLTAYYYRYGEYHEVFCEPLDVQEYRIVGTMEPEMTAGTGLFTDILLPLQTVRDSYAKAGFPFFADSFRFEVKNPLELNEFKEEMRRLGFIPIAKDALFYYKGEALAVQDETFIRAAERMEESISILEGFFPFILLIVAFAGYLTAYLLVQSRRPEYALMRSIGTGKGRSFFLFFLEYLLLTAVGCLAGVTLSALLTVASAQVLFRTAGAFLICYLLGMSAALWLMGRLSPMAVLTRND